MSRDEAPEGGELVEVPRLAAGASLELGPLVERPDTAPRRGAVPGIAPGPPRRRGRGAEVEELGPPRVERFAPGSTRALLEAAVAAPLGAYLLGQQLLPELRRAVADGLVAAVGARPAYTSAFHSVAQMGSELALLAVLWAGGTALLLMAALRALWVLDPTSGMFDAEREASLLDQAVLVATLAGPVAGLAVAALDVALILPVVFLEMARGAGAAATLLVGANLGMVGLVLVVGFELFVRPRSRRARQTAARVTRLLPGERLAALRDRLGQAEVRCNFCRDPVGVGLGVACVACETMHHRDCWTEGGGCAVYACGETHHRQLTEQG